MTFVLKPQAPFERLKMANDCPEVALNRGIILQAIIDASNTGGGSVSKKIARTAYNWLCGKSEGFKQTCFNADLEPNFVVTVAKQMIDLHNSSEKSATFSTKYQERKKKEAAQGRFSNLKNIAIG